MRQEHPDLDNPLDHVTITPFQIYDQLLHNKDKLRAHEGLWIKNFNLIKKLGFINPFSKKCFRNQKYS